MNLKFLVPNQSWAFVFGDSIVQLDNERRLFGKLSEALQAADRHGLVVVKGRVQARDSN